MDTGAPMASDSTVDAAEVARFEALSESWWDERGPMRALHQLNPLRLRFICDHLTAHFGRDSHAHESLKGVRILDLGCGAGLLSEPLARLGATVTAIDAAATNIEVARHHSRQAGLEIDYQAISAEVLSRKVAPFDAVISMEVIEHVADVKQFMATAADLTRPGGALLLSTFNRTLSSYLQAIVAGEYILRLLPRGTHEWHKFVSPAELRRSLRPHGVVVERVVGVGFAPLQRQWQITPSLRGSYMAYARKLD